MIYTKDITCYYINPDSYNHRRNSIEATIDNMKVLSRKRVVCNVIFHDKAMTMTNSHIFALDQIISDNLFPVILLEDDARIIKPLPEFFNIPKEADLIYLGGSNYNCGGTKPDMYIENYNNDFYRVFYMLSAHAILLPTLESASLLRLLYHRAMDKSIFNDISLAESSKDHIFLVPKEGNYFYQDDYTSCVTNFSWLNFKKNI